MLIKLKNLLNNIGIKIWLNPDEIKNLIWLLFSVLITLIKNWIKYKTFSEWKSEKDVSKNFCLIKRKNERRI
jgi:hypothetical protein